MFIQIGKLNNILQIDSILHIVHNFRFQLRIACASLFNKRSVVAGFDNLSSIDNYNLVRIFNCGLADQFLAHPTNPVECCADANPKTMLPNDT